MKYYLIGGGLALLLIAGNAMLREGDRLRADNQLLDKQLQHARQQAEDYRLHLLQLDATLADERDRQAQLLKTHSELATQAESRQQQIRRLQRENQELKDWAAVALPEPVQCLRNRPTLATAADYTAWLSGGHTLHPACP